MKGNFRVTPKLKRRGYLLVSIVYGACFMWCSGLLVELALFMLPIKWGASTEEGIIYGYAAYLLVGAIAGYRIGLRMWVRLYEKNGDLKEKYRGFPGVKRRTSAFFASIIEDEFGA